MSATSKLCIAVCISFLLNNTYAQIKSKPITKLFFEYGYTNCIVKVTNNKNVLFMGKLTSYPNMSGATKIVDINKLKSFKIIISACGKTKAINIKKSKFYAISIIDNLIIVEEVDEEPIYV